MRWLLRFFVISAVIATVAMAATGGTGTIDTVLERYWWQKRQLLVFAPSLDDPRLVAFMAECDRRNDEVRERDLILWQPVFRQQVRLNGETKPQLAAETFYDHFGIAPNAFAMVLIGKDGEVKWRGSDAATLDEVFETIDAMPMRQSEAS